MRLATGEGAALAIALCRFWLHRFYPLTPAPLPQGGEGRSKSKDARAVTRRRERRAPPFLRQAEYFPLGADTPHLAPTGPMLCGPAAILGEGPAPRARRAEAPPRSYRRRYPPRFSRNKGKGHWFSSKWHGHPGHEFARAEPALSEAKGRPCHLKLNRYREKDQGLPTSPPHRNP
jgi:hypothetical protein